MIFEKLVLKIFIFSFVGRRLAFGPAAQAARPASAPAARSPAFASAQLARRGPVHRALPSPLARRARPRQARRAAWRAHTGDAGRVASRGPRKQACLAVFKPPQLRFSQHFSFSSPALRLCLAPHRALLTPPLPLQPRQKNWPPVVHHCPQSSTRRSASLPGTWCSLQAHHLSKV